MTEYRDHYLTQGACYLSNLLNRRWQAQRLSDWIDHFTGCRFMWEDT
jgi:hypothetical protein